MTRPRRKLTIARTGSLIGANEFLKAAGCAPFFHESLWKEKGRERERERETGRRKKCTRRYHVFIGPRLVRGLRTVVRFYGRFSCALARLTRSGRGDARLETRLAYESPLKRFPLSFQRRIRRGLFFLSRGGKPWMEPRGKGGERSKSSRCTWLWCKVCAWMALIRRIENRVWLRAVWERVRERGKYGVVVEEGGRLNRNVFMPGEVGWIWFGWFYLVVDRWLVYEIDRALWFKECLEIIIVWCILWSWIGSGTIWKAGFVSLRGEWRNEMEMEWWIAMIDW